MLHGQKRELALAELKRLREEAVVLERDWRRAPYLGGTLALAVPAYLLGYPLIMLLILLAAPSLVGTALYLLGVRRAENKMLQGELEEQLGEDAALVDESKGS